MGARHDLRRVAEAMERLPRDQREALELAVIEGLEPEQIASRQRISRDTVKTRVSRARQSLRRMLGTSDELQLARFCSTTFPHPFIGTPTSYKRRHSSLF